LKHFHTRTLTSEEAYTHICTCASRRNTKTYVYKLHARLRKYWILL